MIVLSFALVKFYAFAILYVFIVMQIKLVVVVLAVIFGARNQIKLFITWLPCALVFVSCRHDVVMTTREYARGRRCIPMCIPCAFAL